MLIVAALVRFDASRQPQAKTTARGAKARQPGKARSFSIASGLAGAGGYPTLYHQVERADIIFVGVPQGVIRQGVVPWDLPAGEPDSGTRTVWDVKVEKALTGEVGDIAKVAEAGAIVDGNGVFYENSPRLIVGKRYLLFLKKVNEAYTPYGFQARVENGKIYNLGDLDELLLEGADNKLMLENGILVAPYDEYQHGTVTPFSQADSPQILCQSEDAALHEVALTVADKDVIAWYRRMRQK